MKNQQFCISTFVAYPTILSRSRSTSSDMTIVFHAWLYGRFIEIQSNLTGKKIPRMNQGSNFLGGSFGNKDNVRPQSNLEEKVNPSILKDNFSSRTDTSIFISIAPVLLDKLNKTSWVFLGLKSKNTYCLSPDSRSEVSSSCCHRSDA